MKRYCGGCKRNRSLKFFKRKTPTTYQYFCIPCQAEYRKKHYAEHRADYIRRATQQRAAYRIDLRKFIDGLKSKPCADCGKSYPPYVMHFDHRNRRTKEFSVGEAIRRLLSRARVLKEVAKCDVVCSNCHAERTWGPNAVQTRS